MNIGLKSFLKDKVHVILLDADGTFYDGTETRVTIDDKEIILKRRHFHDGQGISFMRALGLRILFVSGEGEPLDSHIRKFNNLPSAKKGDWLPVEYCDRVSGKDKIESIDVWLTKNNFSWADCLYMGDDLNDLVAMLKVKSNGGVVIVPANATRRIKKISDHITNKKGGEGAIRELVEIILDAKGINERNLALS